MLFCTSSHPVPLGYDESFMRVVLRVQSPSWYVDCLFLPSLSSALLSSGVSARWGYRMGYRSRDDLQPYLLEYVAMFLRHL